MAIRTITMAVGIANARGEMASRETLEVVTVNMLDKTEELDGLLDNNYKVISSTSWIQIKNHIAFTMITYQLYKHTPLP